MITLALVVLYVFLVWLLATRVRDGFTYVPLIGLGLGYLIGRAAIDEFGLESDSLPALLAAVLFFAPIAIFVVAACVEGLREWNTRRRLLSPKERARMDSEVQWEDYDPTWLVALVKAQLPDKPGLPERVAACTRCTRVGGNIYFVPPALLEVVRAGSWLVHIDDERSVVIGLLPGGEVAKLEFLKQVPGEKGLVREDIRTGLGYTYRTLDMLDMGLWICDIPRKGVLVAGKLQ